MTANRSMALRAVWVTRADDDTPADDARELLEMLGLVAPGGHELLPDEPPRGRLLNERGRPVATAPRVAAPTKPAKKKRGDGPGRPSIPIDHGTEHGYQQHKRKPVPIPDNDSCGCQAAHERTLKRPRKPAPHESSSVLPPAADVATDEPWGPAGLPWTLHPRRPRPRRAALANRNRGNR